MKSTAMAQWHGGEELGCSMHDCGVKNLYRVHSRLFSDFYLTANKKDNTLPSSKDFLSSPTFDTENPRLLWIQHQDDYPQLFRMGLDILAVLTSNGC